MAKKNTTGIEDTYVMTASDYRAMLAVMEELANRNKQLEGAVMRIAKAGAITDAIKPIIKRRTYAKRMGLDAAAVQDDSTSPKKAAKKSKRKSAARASADNVKVSDAVPVAGTLDDGPALDRVGV